MPVTSVGSLVELTNIMERADASRLIVVDFFAHWCGPCKMISPVFEQMSTEFRNATFLKVNCDEARDIVTRYAISAMPTFLFFKNKQQVDSVRGANQNALDSTIRKHYSSVSSNPNAASDAEKQFLERFVPYANYRTMHNDEVFKALARSVMPEESLMKKATNAEGKVDEVVLLKNLMEWYKNEFFTWFDKPTCKNCTLKATTGGLSGTPTKEEREDGAGRVEVFICEGCNSEMRFPRYNNPVKLLQTRTGRCGEWANCFNLMLCAVGLESRFILDTTDHVWNEVYLHDENRWIHVDPCENVMDRPMLYTKGWNKTLTYVIAYGNDHVADVTWRYVFDCRKVAERRHQVRQAVFENFLGKLNNRQMEGLSEARKKELAVRRTCELMETIVQDAKNLKTGFENLKDDVGGRTTGSEEWRRARGEMGSVVAEEPAKVLGENLKLAPNAEGILEFKYDVINDKYSQEPSNGFLAAAFEAENVKRVVEKDWNMVYLCRKNGEDTGSISWHFDLQSIGKEIEKIEIKIAGIEKFEKANAMAMACLGDICMRIPSKTGILVIDKPASGVLKLSASLYGGEGSIAFQQAQLFRTELKEATAESLVVRIWTK